MSEASLPPIRLYNSMSRRPEEVTVDASGKVGIYWCGVTPYADAHAGHARSAVALDLLVRAIKSRGLDVTTVRNITDIDDKILARSKENAERPDQLAGRLADDYRQDMSAVNCVAPTHEPKVSESIPQVHEIIAKLVANGAAYPVKGDDGIGSDVYFRVRSFAGYGKLSGRNVDDLRAGARIEVSEKKEDPLDFALWKGCAKEDWGWESPWGRGRPGWHIECSAMAAQHLAHGFSIHGGGMDLIFPHHENEIAQSEASRPGEGDYARCWIHNGFLTADKEKMSKSLGNFVTVRDVLARNDGEALRLFLVSSHFRGPLNFDVEKVENDGKTRVIFPGVDEAERKIDYLYATLARSESITVGVASSLTKEHLATIAEASNLRASAHAAIADDLNASEVVAALYRAAAIVNDAMDLYQRKKAERAQLGQIVRFASDLVRELCDLLGIVETPPAIYQARTRARRLAREGLTVEAVEAKIDERVSARKNKDFARADALRVELDGMGIEVFDGVDGTTWRKRV
jgi:cysteinyl-tRNA synthetase